MARNDQNGDESDNGDGFRMLVYDMENHGEMDRI